MASGWTADLTDARLGGADLTLVTLDGANLSGANLTRANLDRADLDRADLTLVTLDGANLSGAVRLTGADFTGALLGANPSVVPPGWVIADSTTGELRPVSA